MFRVFWVKVVFYFALNTNFCTYFVQDKVIRNLRPDDREKYFGKE
jgi:hypothetical protein